MKRHTPWTAVLLLCVTAEVRSRSYRGRSWRLRDGLLLERSLRLRPSWTPNGGWSEPEERMAEEPQNGPWEMSRSKIRETSEHEERDSFGGLSDAEAAGRDVSSLETFVDRSISGGGVQRSNEKVDEGTQTVDNSSEEGVTSGAPLAGALKAGPDDIHPHVVRKSASVISDISFVVLVAGCSAVAVFGVVAAGYCFYKVQKNARAAADVDYPAYGVTGPNKEGASPTADRKLAQSAQMYHFQHQKQQMIAVEKVIECKVPTNTRVYTVAVYFRRKRLATASGHSIQQAVMAAASKALEASKELFPQLSHQRRVLERILKQQAPSKEDEPPTKKSRDDSSTDSRSRHNSSSRSHGSLDRRRTSGETKRRSRSRSRDTSKPEA